MLRSGAAARKASAAEIASQRRSNYRNFSGLAETRGNTF
jgi:hypothetical protein